MSIRSLRVEIWLLILEQLCPHCYCDDVPDFRLIEHQEELSALWALSLTCRSIKELSRQFLYHCFYSTPTHDRASKFLRTLISKPQLGRHVRILSLPCRSLVFEYTSDHSISDDVDREEIKRRDAHTWIQLSSKLSIGVPTFITRAASAKGGLDEDMDLDRIALIKARQWVHDLILRYCPGITHLELPGVSGPKFQGEPPPVLQSLQVLLCHSVNEGGDLSWFLQEAPLMRCLMTYKINYSHLNVPTSHPVTNIRRLSTVLRAFELPYVFSQCPQLEDIEIHLHPCNYYPEAMLADVWPASIKSQAVRLAWSSWPMISPRLEDEGVIVPPIRDFKKLEILEIDRPSLYYAGKRTLGWDTTEEEIGSQLQTILPASLRILHTAFTVPRLDTIVNELQALALAKETFLRNLSIVQIDHPPATEQGEITIGEAMDIRGVTETVADAGLELKFGLNLIPPRSASMGIIPKRPGTMESAQTFGQMKKDCFNNKY